MMVTNQISTKNIENIDIPLLLDRGITSLDSILLKESSLTNFLSELNPNRVEALKVVNQAKKFRQTLNFKHNSSLIQIAKNPIDYLKSFQLRSQVYGNELKYSNEFEGADKTFEYDKFDKHSIHLVSYDPNNILNATSRLILDRGNGLPTGEKINLENIGNETTRGEVSRLAIRADYRKKGLLANISSSIYNIAQQIGVTDLIFSVIDDHVAYYHPFLGGTNIIKKTQKYGNMCLPITTIHWDIKKANKELLTRGMN